MQGPCRQCGKPGIERSCCSEMICNACYYAEIVGGDVNGAMNHGCPHCHKPVTLKDGKREWEEPIGIEIACTKVYIMGIAVAPFLAAIVYAATVASRRWTVFGFRCATTGSDRLQCFGGRDVVALDRPIGEWDKCQGEPWDVRGCTCGLVCPVSDCLVEASGWQLGWDFIRDEWSGAPSLRPKGGNGKLAVEDELAWWDAARKWNYDPEEERTGVPSFHPVTYQWVDRMDDGPDPTWFETPQGSVQSTVCGTIAGDTALRFRGEDPRILQTKPLSIPHGAAVDFWMIYGSGQAVGCSSLEGGMVTLSASIDGGRNWTEIVEMPRDVFRHLNYTHATIRLPKKTWSNTTILRWHQPYYFADFDVWAIDLVRLAVNAPPSWGNSDAWEEKAATVRRTAGEAMCCANCPECPRPDAVLGNTNETCDTLGGEADTSVRRAGLGVALVILTGAVAGFWLLGLLIAALARNLFHRFIVPCILKPTWERKQKSIQDARKKAMEERHLHDKKARRERRRARITAETKRRRDLRNHGVDLDKVLLRDVHEDPTISTPTAGTQPPPPASEDWDNMIEQAAEHGTLEQAGDALVRSFLHLQVKRVRTFFGFNSPEETPRTKAKHPLASHRSKPSTEDTPRDIRAFDEDLDLDPEAAIITSQNPTPRLPPVEDKGEDGGGEGEGEGKRDGGGGEGRDDGAGVGLRHGPSDDSPLPPPKPDPSLSLEATERREKQRFGNKYSLADQWEAQAPGMEMIDEHGEIKYELRVAWNPDAPPPIAKVDYERTGRAMKKLRNLRGLLGGAGMARGRSGSEGDDEWDEEEDEDDGEDDDDEGLDESTPDQHQGERSDLERKEGEGGDDGEGEGGEGAGVTKKKEEADDADTFSIHTSDLSLNDLQTSDFEDFEWDFFDAHDKDALDLRSAKAVERRKKRRTKVARDRYILEHDITDPLLLQDNTSIMVPPPPTLATEAFVGAVRLPTQRELDRGYWKQVFTDGSRVYAFKASTSYEMVFGLFGIAAVFVGAGLAGLIADRWALFNSTELSLAGREASPEIRARILAFDITAREADLILAVFAADILALWRLVSGPLAMFGFGNGGLLLYLPPIRMRTDFRGWLREAKMIVRGGGTLGSSLSVPLASTDDETFLGEGSVAVRAVGVLIGCLPYGALAVIALNHAVLLPGQEGATATTEAEVNALTARNTIVEAIGTLFAFLALFRAIAGPEVGLTMQLLLYEMASIFGRRGPSTTSRFYASTCGFRCRRTALQALLAFFPFVLLICIIFLAEALVGTSDAAVSAREDVEVIAPILFLSAILLTVAIGGCLGCSHNLPIRATPLLRSYDAGVQLTVHSPRRSDLFHVLPCPCCEGRVGRVAGEGRCDGVMDVIARFCGLMPRGAAHFELDPRPTHTLVVSVPGVIANAAFLRMATGGEIFQGFVRRQEGLWKGWSESEDEDDSDSDESFIDEPPSDRPSYFTTCLQKPKVAPRKKKEVKESGDGAGVVSKHEQKEAELKEIAASATAQVPTAAATRTTHIRALEAYEEQQRDLQREGDAGEGGGASAAALVADAEEKERQDAEERLHQNAHLRAVAYIAATALEGE